MLLAQPVIVSKEDVHHAFFHVNSWGTSSPDIISMKTLKLCNDSLAPVYTSLLWQSVLEGCIPHICKASAVIPVPKRRSPSQLNDHR